MLCCMHPCTFYSYAPIFTVHMCAFLYTCCVCTIVHSNSSTCWIMCVVWYMSWLRSRTHRGGWERLGLSTGGHNIQQYWTTQCHFWIQLYLFRLGYLVIDGKDLKNNLLHIKIVALWVWVICRFSFVNMCGHTCICSWCHTNYQTHLCILGIKKWDTSYVYACLC